MVFFFFTSGVSRSSKSGLSKYYIFSLLFDRHLHIRDGLTREKNIKRRTQFKSSVSADEKMLVKYDFSYGSFVLYGDYVINTRVSKTICANRNVQRSNTSLTLAEQLYCIEGNWQFIPCHLSDVYPRLDATCAKPKTTTKALISSNHRRISMNGIAPQVQPYW